METAIFIDEIDEATKDKHTSDLTHPSSDSIMAVIKARAKKVGQFSRVADVSGLLAEISYSKSAHSNQGLIMVDSRESSRTSSLASEVSMKSNNARPLLPRVGKRMKTLKCIDGMDDEEATCDVADECKVVSAN